MSAVFIGCVEFSKILLEEIISIGKIPVVGVVTKRKSKFNSDFYDLTEVAGKNGIKVFYYTGTESNNEMVDWIKTLSPNVIFCFGWSHLLPVEIFNLAPLGTIGYHPASLPANRGRHPIIWSLVLGLKSTSSTFFKIDEGADSGEIVSQENTYIDENDDAMGLYTRLEKIAVKQVRTICQEVSEGKLSLRAQDHNKANYWRKRTEKDGEIDWRMSSRSIHNLVRGISKPYPGAFFVFENEKVRVWKARIYEEEVPLNFEAGKILKVHGSCFVVKTGEGAIEILDYSSDNFQPIEGMYL